MNPENSVRLGTNIGTSGTIVLDDQGSGILARVIFGGTYVGSLEFYDSKTTTGTAAGNLMYQIGLPLLNQYKTIDLGFPYKKGLTLVATGTPIAGAIWQK